MQTLGSQSAGNGDFSSNHVAAGFGPEDVISDDEDVIMEEEQPQSRAGVFSKFRNVCQNVFQSLIGGKQRAPDNKASETTTTRIIRRRSRQTLVPAEMQRKASELSVLSGMQASSLPINNQAGTSSFPGTSSALNHNITRPSTNNLLATAATVNANSMEIGSRLAMPSLKRGHSDAPTSSEPTPFKSEATSQSFTAPWSALKQRRLEETSIRHTETLALSQPATNTVRVAPVIETTSLQQTIRESDRYSSMTLPSSHLHQPASRDFGSAMSGETSSLTTPLGAKRRVSLFETKTMTPHFNVEKMEALPYHTLDRFPARASPRVSLASPRTQSPLAPRVVRLDVSTSKPSPHSPLVRAPIISVPTVVNPTAQRLAKAYQQLTSATVPKPQMTPVDPTRVHLIDPAQFFSRPKVEVAESAPSKVEPVSVRPVEQPQVVQQPKMTSRFTPSTLASHEPIDTGKVKVGQPLSSSGKFLLTAPSVLLDGESGSVGSIWTCSDCDIANSISNEYCFSCGRSKASSSKAETAEVKPQMIEQPDVAVKRQRPALQIIEPISQKTLAPPVVIAPPTAETSRVLGGGPSATSTPFTMSAGMAKKTEEPSLVSSVTKPSAPSGGVVGQWRCSNCLFMNDFKAISCARCSRSSSLAPSVIPPVSVNGLPSASEAIAATTTVAASTTPAAGASSRLKRRATLEGGWVCACQHMNPRSATVCDLCNAPKPQASVAPTITPSVPVVPKTTASTEPIFKPINGVSAAPAQIVLPPISLPVTTESVRLTTATATTTSLTAPIPTPAPIFGTGVSEKPVPTTTSAPSTSTTATLAAPLSSTGFGSQFAAKEGQWTCDVCMVRNDKDKMKCAACESPNPNAPKTAPTEAPKFGVLAASSGGFAFGFGAKPAEAATTTTSSTVSFGIPPAISTPATTAPPPTMGGFKFGGTTSPVAAATTAAPVSTTTTTAPAFAFGSMAKPAAITASAPGGFAFTFGASTAPSTATTTSSAPATVFGAPSFGTAPTAVPSTTQAPSFFGSAPTTTTSVFGMPPATTTAASTTSLFGTPATTAAPIPSFGSTFGAPQTTQAPSSGLFGSATTTTSAGTTAPLFAFGTATATPATTTSAPSSGFAFSSATTAPSFPFAPAATTQATTGPTSSFAFGSAAAVPTTTAPNTAFAFGSGSAAPAATTAPSTAASAFSFGSQTSTTTSAFSFGGNTAQPSSTAAAPQTNGTSLFAFGANAPSTTASTFGQPAPASTAATPFPFGALSQQPPAAASTATSTAPAFNFAPSVPSFGSTTTANSAVTTNGTTGGFKFETSATGFNFTAGNPPAGPVTATPQAPAFVFNSGSGFSPAQGGADGPMLFSSGATVGQNRPKAAAVRKLKVAGRK